MAAITSINAGQAGAFVADPTVLTSSDTITIAPGKKQLAVFRNGTGGSLNPIIDGAGGSTVDGRVLGLGDVSVASGYTFALAAGATKAVVLSTISAYCQGVVTITGGTGISLTIFDL